METISRSLLTFLLNSLWQIPLAAAVAAAVCWSLRKGPAVHRHAVWVAALVASLLLPLTSMRRADPSDMVQFPASLAAQPSSAQPLPALATAPPTAPAPFRSISLAATTASLLLAAYFLFILFRFARLARALYQTATVRRAAQLRTLPSAIEDVRACCQQALATRRVRLLFSPKLSGPVTAGADIILPQSLLSETSQDVLTTAIGHEMAHVARRDFVWNIVYELLYLPVSFHPAAWTVRRGIDCTREMACDEMVTRRLLSPDVYARSIMSIATAMTALPRPGYTLGVFDGDILEQRLRRLLQRPVASLQRGRLLLASGLTALAICAVLASSLSVTARAQGTVADLLQKGEAAFNSGDFKTATADYSAAVKLQPDNLEPKLQLAKTLMRQYTIGSDPSSPLVTGAHQQLTDVFARDPHNTRALHGLMILTANSRQFAESREWAQKSIQADPSDATAYYTVGFLDWATIYPEFTKGRRAAGMKPQDNGIIPDASIRQTLKAKYQGQIEDGIRMLQTALQINPNYADAMAYMNLMYRLDAYVADTPADYSELIAKADDWVGKALAAQKVQAKSGQPAKDGMWLAAPPPPPPPPPPPGRAPAVPRTPPTPPQ